MGVTLSSPVTDKHTQTVENKYFRVGTSSMQGWRVSMEDAHSIQLEIAEDPTSAYFGVFDGHGGPLVAEYAGKHLHEHIISQEHYWKNDIPKAIELAYLALDARMRDDKDLRDDMSGSTAVIVLVKDGKVYCGNAGDSRAIAFIKDKVVPLSADHKPTELLEYKRIKDSGGWVEANRVNGNLAVSRALGDFIFKRDLKRPPEEQTVIALPDVSVHDLTEDWSFILLACDGIWDVMSSEEVGLYVKARLDDGVDVGTICETLMMNCLAPNTPGPTVGWDNMTVILIQILCLPEAKEKGHQSMASDSEPKSSPPS